MCLSLRWFVFVLTHSWGFLKSNLEALLEVKLLNIFIKAPVSILDFPLISLFWKANPVKYRDRR